MKLLQKIGREFTGYNVLESAKRLVDRKPLQCSLYVTDRCNLDCGYCTEYDNSRPHPSIEDLKTWVKKIRDLGTMRIALVGGEPLVHPHIVDLVRYCRELGFATSLTTNGFLLTREKLRALEEAGLQVMQISVDRMTPSAITKKSFKTILPKLEYFKDSKVSLHITGVICADTLSESQAVLETGLSRGIPTEVRLVHADPMQRFRVERGSPEELEAFIDSMIERKRRGEKIHTSEAILKYQRSLLRKEHVEWTCMAGYKLFFVSAQGKFWICSMVHTDKHIMDITLDDLYANNRKKSCQVGCGVYCSVSTSLVVQQPVRVLGKEIIARAKRMSPFRGRGNVNGASHANGSVDHSPPTNGHVSLGSNAEQQSAGEHPHV
ncbi:MAG: radical SAM protein, partial [Spartobacteria bacterium]